MMRRLGLVCFAVGVILFFVDKYVFSIVHFFASPFFQGQAAAAAFETYYVVQLVVLALIVAGAVMFIAARRQQKLAASG